MRHYETGEQLQSVRWDYVARTDGQPVYAGYTYWESANEAALNWVIHKFTYDVSDNATHKQVAVGAWSDRLILVYR